MRLRRDGYDARWRRGPETVEQQVGQQKWREVIDRKSEFEPVPRKPVFRRKQPGVVDQQVEPLAAGQDVVRQPAHLGEARKVTERDRSVTNRRAASVRPRSRPVMTTRIPERASPSAV